LLDTECMGQSSSLNTLAANVLNLQNTIAMLEIKVQASTVALAGYTVTNTLQQDDLARLI